MAMHNGKTVLHNVINLYVYMYMCGKFICIYVYMCGIYIYTYIYIHIYIYVLHIVFRVESQLATFIRGRS